ncbi:MAG: (Fe-S)-binding protein [Deltaproteobacteria bacterium]|nr:(Fe-S)-binding protein [Deltaproteobacteria bacterium]
MNKTPKKQQPPFRHLQDIAEELDKCAQCGECRSVCPIFESLEWEKFSARGKVALTRSILSGQIELTPAYEKVVQNCLLCLACVENCSSGVRMDHIILAARNQLKEEKGLPFFQRMFHQLLLLKRGLIDFLAMGGSASQYLLFKRLPRKSGLKRRFPLPMVEKERYVPALVFRPFRKRMPRENRSLESKRTILFFTGCLVNYVNPHIGKALVKVLNLFKTDVIIPKHQHCCGAPAEVGGDRETVRALARKNLDTLFEGSFDIITVCASGGYMLKKIYPDFFTPEDHYYSKALSVASRTYDISEYLVNKIGLGGIKKHLKKPPADRITYHDPCHLARGQGVTKEPRQLLQAIFGELYVEMPMADRCCGSGGTYGLTHRSTSVQILNKKTENIISTGADIVTTGCPGCMIQLKDGLKRHDKDQSVFHVIELIARQLSYASDPKPQQKNFSSNKT